MSKCQKLNIIRSKFKIFKYYKDLNELIINKEPLHLRELAKFVSIANLNFKSTSFFTIYKK